MRIPILDWLLDKTMDFSQFMVKTPLRRQLFLFVFLDLLGLFCFCFLFFDLQTYFQALEQNDDIIEFPKKGHLIWLMPTLPLMHIYILLTPHNPSKKQNAKQKRKLKHWMSIGNISMIIIFVMIGLSILFLNPYLRSFMFEKNYIACEPWIFSSRENNATYGKSAAICKKHGYSNPFHDE